MKRIFRFLSPSFSALLTAIVLLFLGGPSLFAQDDEAPQKDTRPVRNTFESIWLIDNQTVMVPIKGTFEFDIIHRFGTLNGQKYDDFYGIFAPSNIRLGFNFVPVERLQVGIGFTKENNMIDFNGKYAILRQGRSGGSPVSLTYLGYATIDTGNKRNTQIKFNEGIDRLSYFNQLMVARKITDALSLQASGSLSWFNFKDLQKGELGYLSADKNAHFAAGFLGRYKLTPVMGLIANVDIPLSQHEFTDNKANISFGVEMVSSSHAFQIFVGNYKSILPQYNNSFSSNSDFLIGFNITRLWNF